MIRLEFNSFNTDMGILMMQKESQQKNRNFVFVVHITDLILTYAFRAIPLTENKLQLIMIVLKRSPFSFSQLIQNGKVEHIG